MRQEKDSSAVGLTAYVARDAETKQLVFERFVVSMSPIIVSLLIHRSFLVVLLC